MYVRTPRTLRPLQTYLDASGVCISGGYVAIDPHALSDPDSQ